LNTSDESSSSNLKGPIDTFLHHLPPEVVAFGSGSIERLGITNSSEIDAVSGTIRFADINASDRPTVSANFDSFTYQNAQHNDVTATLTAQQLAAIAAVEVPLVVVPDPGNTNIGSATWTYSVADGALDFLAAGEILTLIYRATVDDSHGGVITSPLTVSITGTNDAPVILGETNAPTQAVIVGSLTPVILDQGVNANSIGLAAETFDSLSGGALSNNGAGTGNFHSAILNATFSASGNAGIVSGSFAGVTGAPFVGPGVADTTNYLSIGAGGTETITFASEENTFGLYWGSVDSYNTISFYNGTTLVASYTGNDISPLFATGNQGSFSSNGYVEFYGLSPFNKVVLGTGDTNAFEIDNISVGFVHNQLAAPVSGTLTISDADIGDTLTASVTGNATIEYNGSAALPANADVNALIAGSAISFDSVTTNGGTEVLHSAYHPNSPDLDFLKAGDTLTIAFTAQVNDGHVSVGDQPLTITIVGADRSANTSGFEVVSGTSQNDTFHNVGNGVNIFGGGGQDTFVFNLGFGSATIGDFDVNTDTININHALVDSVSALLASAQSVNSGHDTIMSDTAHDTITLKGVTVAQLQAHPSDFHLV
jgi:fibronectin-binding autotransporter adhesin